jgi:hypothetical protein
MLVGQLVLEALLIDPGDGRVRVNVHLDILCDLL